VTYRQTQYHGIYCASMASRGKTGTYVSKSV